MQKSFQKWKFEKYLHICEEYFEKAVWLPLAKKLRSELLSRFKLYHLLLKLLNFRLWLETEQHNWGICIGIVAILFS